MIDKIDGTCIICYGGDSYMLLTQCNHILCLDCMHNYTNTYHNNTCPYCRQVLKFKGYAEN
jgi:Zn finger protein HypA/HybF involved in hydrogenase expression